MGGMRAVLFRLQTTVGRRWLPTLLVAAVIAVVSGAVLTLAAGARRTAQAPDAFTAAIGGGPDVTVTQGGDVDPIIGDDFGADFSTGQIGPIAREVVSSPGQS